MAAEVSTSESRLKSAAADLLKLALVVGAFGLGVVTGPSGQRTACVKHGLDDSDLASGHSQFEADDQHAGQVQIRQPNCDWTRRQISLSDSGGRKAETNGFEPGSGDSTFFESSQSADSARIHWRGRSFNSAAARHCDEPPKSAVGSRYHGARGEPDDEEFR